MDTRLIRTRWAAIGAAVAVTLGAGGIGLVDAAKGSGERAVYTPIEPCRLLDTRPAQGVGGKTSPLGPGEILEIDLANAADECPDQPGDVTGVGLNVTALFATTLTDLRFWAEGDPPNAANLNPAPGQPPTPNAVTTGVAADGTFLGRNQAGNVHLIIDLVGIYQDHNHDDRYYTEDEVDDAIANAVAGLGPQPIAMGRVLPNGTLNVGFGVASTSWDAGNSRYQITLTGVSYNSANFVSVTTPHCPSAVEPMIGVGSVGGNMLVTVWDDNISTDDVPVDDCGFSFIVYQV